LQPILNITTIKKEQYESSSRLINVAGRILTSRLQVGLQEDNMGITVEEWRILFYLWKEDKVNQQELALKSNKEKSTITRKINALEKKGLISRENHLTDKRNNTISLTAKGRELESNALSIARAITTKAEKNIEERELENFKKVLTKIISNLN